MSSHKRLRPLNVRREEAKRMMEKYPERYPVVIECAEGSGVKKLEMEKYMVPHHFTVGQFLVVLRKKISLAPDKAIYLYTGGVIPETSQLMSQLYQDKAEDDGFLYMTYASESTFG